MPFDSNESLPKGVKSLPPAQQTKWRKVFNAAYEGTCKNRGKDRDACASKIAWSQISGKYKGSVLAEFSMAITRAVQTKEDIFRWKATASDTDNDVFNDQMSLDLFKDFTDRIEINELAPENYRSSFWQGGMPYVSVSHYPDLEGKAVPGIVEKVFVDGNQLKSYGQFSKTKIGMACYNSIFADLYEEPKPENPVRISIAFLDFGHTHKSNNFEFIRENLDDICPECIKEMVKGKFGGKIYKKGQLVHLAFTRFPANERTDVEVEKSMTTRKEDAASIIGEELADEIDEEAKLVGKSQALIIRTDDDDTEAEKEPTETTDGSEEELFAEAELVSEAKSKKDKKMAEDEEEEDEEDGEDCKKKSTVDISERLESIEKSLAEIVKPAPVKEHELDPVLTQFKSAYDEIKAQLIPGEEKLKLLQESFNDVGRVVIENMKSSNIEPEHEPVQESHTDEALQKLSSVVQDLATKVDILLTKQQENVVKSNPAIPVRRSIAPTLSMQSDIQISRTSTPEPVSETPKLHKWIRDSYERASGQRIRQ